MESNFKIGDYVWAKMKGFPAWPGKVIEPKTEVRRPADKKPKKFVFFFGSENYAWIADDSIWQYVANRARFALTNRVPRGFREAMESMDDVIKNLPEEELRRSSLLPSIEDEIAQVGVAIKTRCRRRADRRSVASGNPKLMADATRPDAPAPLDDPSTDDKPVKREKRDVVRVRKSLSMRSPAISKIARKRASTASPGTQKRSRLVVKVGANKRSGGAVASPPPWAAAAAAVSAPPVRSDHLRPILELMQQGAKALSPNSTTTNSTAKQDLPEERETRRSCDFDYEEPIVLLPKNIIATPMKIGFLGLGAMGSGMVTNLLNSGHEVTVWNRTPSCCREFVKIGALKGNSPSEVVQSCDMTFSCVSDPSALKDLVFGNCGVLQGIGVGKAYIDMSTVDVETITDVHEAVTTRGGRFLEAPVIGSRGPAMQGQLLVLAAGDRALFDDCYSCFEAIGQKSYYLGEVGSATKMNLVISMLAGTVLAGLAESMALAEHLGLDHGDVLEIVSMSPVNCPLVRSKGNAMVKARFSDPHCRLHLCQKDLRLAVNMSDAVEQPLHVASAVNELFKKAKAKGYGDHDSAAVYRAADL